MDCERFIRCCGNLRLLNQKCSLADARWIFARVLSATQRPKQRGLLVGDFCRALDLVTRSSRLRRSGTEAQTLRRRPGSVALAGRAMTSPLGSSGRSPLGARAPEMDVDNAAQFSPVASEAQHVESFPRAASSTWSGEHSFTETVSDHAASSRRSRGRSSSGAASDRATSSAWIGGSLPTVTSDPTELNTVVMPSPRAESHAPVVGVSTQQASVCSKPSGNLLQCCGICQLDKPMRALVPCGHVVCAQCSMECNLEVGCLKTCPFCRRRIAHIITLFAP